MKIHSLKFQEISLKFHENSFIKFSKSTTTTTTTFDLEIDVGDE